MDPALKQRLVGAGVLVALAVIFLPMLVQGPAPDSGVSDVPLSVPDAPRQGFETRDLPLVEPETAPAAGALGMPAPSGSAPSAPMATRPDSSEMYPAPTAGGDYAVEFDTFPDARTADAAVASLRASQLPGYREADVDAAGQPVQRVRIGPFSTRPDAEAARLRASQAGGRGSLQVVVLDAPEPPAPAPAGETPAAPATKPAPAPVKTATVAAPPAASTAKVAAADTGFAVQLAAFGSPADAIALRDRARAAGFSAFTEAVATDKGTLTRVRIGPVATRAEAERLQAQAQAKLGIAGAVRPHP